MRWALEHAVLLADEGILLEIVRSFFFCESLLAATLLLPLGGATLALLLLAVDPLPTVAPTVLIDEVLLALLRFLFDFLLCEKGPLDGRAM